MRAANLRHRTVVVVVRRSDGHIVVHQRAAWKDVHPSKWDVAFGGVPGVGESDDSAAVRELAEEAGVVVTSDELTDLGTLESSDAHTRWQGRFYLLTSDQKIEPVDGEVARLAEVAIGDLETWANSTPVCDDVTAVVIPHLMTLLSD